MCNKEEEKGWSVQSEVVESKWGECEKVSLKDQKGG